MRIHYAPGIWTPQASAPVAPASERPALPPGRSFAHGAAAWSVGPAPSYRRADPDSLHSLSGQTMGTHWRLRLDNPQFRPLAGIRAVVEQALALVIAQMSHWEADSDLSRFNQAPTHSWHTLPAELHQVLEAGLYWARASQGAFDPSLGALVAAWGFGPSAPAPADWRPASTQAVAQAMQCSGWQRLAQDAQGRWLQTGGLHLDLSGIAKGFAVDWVLEQLRAQGLDNCLLEIGGELRASGQRPDGQPWRVAIAPQPGQPPTAIALRDCAIATSGDLYHAHHWQGRNYSHTLDGRSGHPITHTLASVSVLHPQCMHADALATVLTVLGPEQGLAFAEEQHIAALLSSPHHHWASSAWRAQQPCGT